MPKLTNTLRALRRPAVIIAALTLASGAAELDAQAVAGDTVRITTGRAKGIYEFRAIRGDTVVVREHDAAVGIPLSRIDRIEVGTRRGPERIVLGAILGVGIGAATGALVGRASGDDCDGTTTFCLGMSADEKASFGAVALGAIGFIGGAIIGAQSPWSWKRVGPENLALQAAPTLDGFSLQVSFRPGRSSTGAPRAPREEQTCATH